MDFCVHWGHDKTSIFFHCTTFQNFIRMVQQDFQLSNVELSLDLHVPNVSLERIYAPPVVHNDQALMEFTQGEERCLKFINQD